MCQYSFSWSTLNSKYAEEIKIVKILHNEIIYEIARFRENKKTAKYIFLSVLCCILLYRWPN